MIGRDEIKRALTGTWRIFTGEKDALSWFDTSTEGFWRSFQAVILVAPAYLITALADRQSVPDIDGGLYWTVRVVTLAFDWVTFPILIGGLAGFLGLKEGYARFITVRNWSTVVAVIPFVALAVVELAGIDNESVMLIPSVLALAFALRLSYLVARRTLGVPIDVALGLVLLDVLVSLALVRIVAALFGINVSG